MTDGIEVARQRVRSGTSGSAKAALGRVGLVAEGVVYALVGFLALHVAAGNRGARADQVGAVEYVARQPLGKFLLVALTAALFALAAWRLLEVLTGDPVEGDDAAHRGKYAIKGVLYLGLAVSALSITLANLGKGNRGGGGSTGASTTATVFDWPAGRWLVALGGVLLIAYALHTAKEQVVEHRFAEWLTEPEDGWLVRLGQVGYAARAVVYLFVGVFLIQAAVAYDATEAKGISGAMRELGGEAWGRLLLWAVAAGLMAFGVFLVAQVRYRRAT
ncbi:DUF1206 domain-containing protein [soil metagenome]